MAIPDNAKKVFSWINFDVYHYEQLMFDWTYKTFEKLKRNHSIDIIVVTENNKILILKESQPGREEFYWIIWWSWEDNETPIKTAKRELLEETWLLCNDLELLLKSQNSSRIEHFNYLFIAKNCTKIASQKLDSWEKIEIIECDWDNFKNYVTKENFRVKELQLLLLKELFFWREEEFKSKLFNKN